MHQRSIKSDNGTSQIRRFGRLLTHYRFATIAFELSKIFLFFSVIACLLSVMYCMPVARVYD